ncbi:hypothetical protein HGRIS_012148 [Hohenbuehelia grisea]|uniref:Major facilitator superfamily (MFS) profile domain-containing protein n=1 Tax=Hohenbuehelia grisea TaxID=104357 RepID=A0ABR3IRG1_9AGAR
MANEFTPLHVFTTRNRLFMLSIANPSQYYQIFLAQGVGLGVGSGLLYTPAIAVQAHHWKSRRAFAMGSITTGTAFGGIILPIVLNQLFQSIGFAWAVRASAFVVLFSLAASCLLMKSRQQPDMPSPSDAPREARVSFVALLTDVPYMIATLSYFLISWGLFFPFFYLQLYAVLHGIDTKLAFYTITIMNAASLPGRVLPSMLADRFGPLNIMIPMCFVSGILIFAMLGVQTVAATVVFAVLYGIFSGGFFSLLGACISAFSKDYSELGVRLGFVFFLSAFGPLAGTPIDGALLQGDAFTWWKSIVFSGCALLLGTSLLAVARYMLVARKGTRRL